MLQGWLQLRGVNWIVLCNIYMPKTQVLLSRKRNARANSLLLTDHSLSYHVRVFQVSVFLVRAYHVRVFTCFPCTRFPCTRVRLRMYVYACTCTRFPVNPLDSASCYSAIQKLKPCLQFQVIPMKWQDSYIFYFLSIKVALSSKFLLPQTKELLKL
jgi:hypothetical protein